MDTENTEIAGLTKKIHGFWEERAEKFRGNFEAVTNDPLIKELELGALEKVVDPAADLLEAGCGNGANVISLASRVEGHLYGFDYSEQMIQAAQSGSEINGVAGRIHFSVGDVLGDLSHFPKFSQLFTDRCLINLPSHELQVQAALNLAERVEEGGHLIFIECARQPLENLNQLRSSVGLAPIPEHWHNLYIDEDRFLADVGNRLRLEKVDSFSSLYYVASRVFNAKLTPEGEKPDYLADINKVSCQLPSFGDYGPHKLYLFKK